MENKNESCLIIQCNPKDNSITGLEITNTYNFWEKDAFVQMHEKSLFPFRTNGIKFRNYQEWYDYTKIFILSGTAYITIKQLKNILPKVFYPGYD